MKYIFLTALFSTAAVAQLPDGYYDFRGGKAGLPGQAAAPPGKSMGAKTDAALNAILSQTPKSLKGPYKAKVLEIQPLEGHTIYSPSDPPPTGQKWPGFIYHNNGCLAIGKVDQKIVLEISSFGYYVIADGNINATFTSGPGGGPNFAPSDNGVKAIEWVVDQAGKGKLPDVDATKFGVAGTSCGGILTYNTLQHKRALAAAIISSGLFGGAGRDKLKDLKKPIGFFEGGPFDGGTRNGQADYDTLTTPTVWANGPFGHGGGAGFMTTAVATFMDWQLKGNKTAGQAFLDEKNNFIKSLGYTEVKRKNWT